MNFRDHIIPFCILLVAIPFFSQCGTGDTDREANRLFVEAYRMTELGREKERTDPVTAYEYYRSALDNINRIIDEHSGSQVAVNVTQQQTYIGEMTIGELRNLVPRMETRARALDSFHRLTIYLTGRLEDEVETAGQRIRYAEWVLNTGDEERYHEVMNMVAEWAHGQWNVELTDPVYARIARSYSDSGRWHEAIETIDLIQNRDLLYSSLEHLLRSGVVRESGESTAGRLLLYLDYLNVADKLRLIQIMAEDLFALDMREEAEALIPSGIPAPEDNMTLDHIDALTGLSAVYASHGSYELSRVLIDEIGKLDENYTGFALRELSTLMARHGETDEALEIIGAFGRDYFRDTALAGVSIELARQGRISDALRMLENVPDDISNKAEASIEIAYLLSDYGDLQRSDSLLDSSRLLIENIDSPVHRSELHVRITENYLARNARSYAAQELDNAENAALGISRPEAMNHILADIISIWIRLGRPDRILALSDHLQTGAAGFEEHIVAIFDLLLDAGYHELARTLAGMTDEPHYFQFLLNRCYIERKNIDRARELAYDIRNYVWRARAQADLADLLWQSGNSPESVKAAGDAIQTTDRIRATNQKLPAFIYTSSRLSASGITMNEELKSLSSKILIQFEL